MSTNTPVFGLFQYNPITDGNLPFNITQALNNNWNAIDSLALPAAAAASPYNPSGTYAVGDFCTYNGTLQKCNTPIPSGEAWNAAHWTETTVAEELAEVRVSLSNKAELYTILIDDSIPQTWSELWALQPGIYSWVQTKPISGWQPDDTPDGLLRVELKIHRTPTDGTYTVELSYVDGATNLKRYYGELQGSDSSGRFAPIATATPPEEHAIVPKNGATFIDGYKNSYSKDQFGRVVVVFSLHFESVPESSIEIFSLPQSFAPTGGTVVGAAVLSMSVYFPALVTAHTNGMVTVGHNVTGYSGPINLHGFLVIDTGGTK